MIGVFAGTSQESNVWWATHHGPLAQHLRIDWNHRTIEKQSGKGPETSIPRDDAKMLQ
jgi:hypothetical protein